MTLLNKLALSALLGIVVFNVHAHDNAFCDYLEKNSQIFSPTEQNTPATKSTTDGINLAPALLGFGLSTIGSAFLAKSILEANDAIQIRKNIIYLSNTSRSSDFIKGCAALILLALLQALLQKSISESLKNAAIGLPISLIGYKQLEKSGLTKKVKTSLSSVLQK